MIEEKLIKKTLLQARTADKPSVSGNIICSREFYGKPVACGAFSSQTRFPADIREYARSCYEQINAKAMYIYDLKTHDILYKSNIHKRLFTGSINKLPLGLLLMRAGTDLDTVIEIPQRLQPELDAIIATNGLILGITPGMRFSLINLLQFTMINSCCDTAAAIADYLSGGDRKKYISMANELLRSLGCHDTWTSSPHGLFEETDPLPLSSAYDVALIAEKCMEYNSLSAILSSYGFDAEQDGSLRHFQTTLRMQDPESEFYRPYIHGIKSGSTDLAGLCLCMCAEYKRHNLMFVELGAPISFEDETPVRNIYRSLCHFLDAILGFND